jgi:hypothetical protein
LVVFFCFFFLDSSPEWSAVSSDLALSAGASSTSISSESLDIADRLELILCGVLGSADEYSCTTTRSGKGDVGSGLCDSMAPAAWKLALVGVAASSILDGPVGLVVMPDVIGGGGNSDAVLGLGVVSDVVFSPPSRPAPGEPGKFIDRKGDIAGSTVNVDMHKHGELRLQLMSERLKKKCRSIQDQTWPGLRLTDPGRARQGLVGEVRGTQSCMFRTVYVKLRMSKRR